MAQYLIWHELEGHGPTKYFKPNKVHHQCGPNPYENGVGVVGQGGEVD